MISGAKNSFNKSFVKVSNFDKAFLPLIFCCVFYIIKAINFPVHDFANYYFGGKFLANDIFTSDIYFPYEFNKAIYNLGYPEIFASYAPNTPFLAVLFLPISYMPIEIAKVAFNFISTILFIISIYKLFCFYKIDFKCVILIPILFFIPIKNNLLFGQVYFLLFFLLVEFWLAYEKNKKLNSAIFLSLAILLKVFPILFIFIFLFKKQYQLLFYTIGICFLFFGISCFFTGIDIWIFFIQSVLPKASSGEIATAFVNNYQSVFMFFKELLVFDAIENPSSFFNNPILFSGLIAGFKIALIAIGFYVCKNVTQPIIIFSYCILFSILISPYGSTYTFILLIFVFLALLKTEISCFKKVVYLVLIFLINNLPTSIFINYSFPFSYLRLLFLITFFILFISFFYQYINWKIISILFLLTIVTAALFKKNEIPTTDYLLNKNAPILIFDYKIENNSLTYFYWNIKGENEQIFPFKFKTIYYLKIKDNQVFYKNKQVTFDNSNKLKAVLINNKTIIYLSDLDRGIGFYTIRSMKI